MLALSLPVFPFTYTSQFKLIATMVPKHGLSSTEDSLPKRLRSSETLASRSATPAEINSTKPSFKVHYHPFDLNHKQPKTDKELGKHAKFLKSPFVEGAKTDELDQYFSVEPFRDWQNMKKYNNFISKLSHIVLPEHFTDMLYSSR